MVDLAPGMRDAGGTMSLTLPRAFLGVTRSALGRPWRDRLDIAGLGRAEALSRQEGLSDILSRLLAARDVEPAEALRFLEPKLRDLLPDPVVLTDMAGAAARLARAGAMGEHVAIFGDYDVDGACSSALLAGFLHQAGARPRIHIPDRLIEGYGPNSEAIRMLAGEGATLLVTVDCGTTSEEPLAEARRLGLDVVVLDHHQAPERLPQVEALVNPNRQDDLSGLGHLCAAGVVFLALVATARQLRGHADRPPPDLLGFLDLVALASICDVVPLTGVNRAFVVKGLVAMRRMQNAGIAALARVARIGEPLNAFHLGYLLGPRINAGGRIGDAALGARLLATADPAEAESIAATLDRLNQERQAMEQEMLAEARAEADAELAAGDGPAVLVTARDGWHPGVVGLIASRLKEHARRPVFAISFNANGIGTGSGRSIAGLRMLPRSPPVQVTTVTSWPSAT